MKPHECPTRTASMAATARLVDPKWQGPVPLFSWGGLLSPAFWVMLIITFCIAWLLPDSVAQERSELRHFALLVRSLLLSISPYADINSQAKSTSFPNAALVSHAWLWFGMLVMFVFNTIATLVLWRYWMEWFLVFRPIFTTDQKRASIFGWALVMVIVIVFTMMSGSTNRIGGADLTSRLFFAFLTGVALFLWQISTAGWLPAIFTIVTRKFFRR